MTWTPVPGYEGSYEARQDPPAVRSLDRVIIDKHGKSRCLRGRVMYGDGYGNLILSKDGVPEHITVSEVLERTFDLPIAV